MEVLVEKKVSRSLFSTGLAAALRAVCAPGQRVSPSSASAPVVVGEGRRRRRALAQRRRRLQKRAAKVAPVSSAVVLSVEKVNVVHKPVVVSGEVEVAAPTSSLSSSGASATGASSRPPRKSARTTASVEPNASVKEMECDDVLTVSAAASATSSKGLGSGRSGRRRPETSEGRSVDLNPQFVALALQLGLPVPTLSELQALRK